MQLLPNDGTGNFRAVAGTISELAALYHQKLTLKGYSLLQEEIQAAFIEEVKRYAGWQSLTCQKSSAVPIAVDEHLILEAFEWVIIEPCVKANCDLIQASLVEASRSMGGDGFGMSVSEAEQAYEAEKEKMPKNAFVQPPFSFKTAGGN
ncbi:MULTISPECIES: hypothetical protein [Acinetobacter]|uniref:Uncharacterized protein n=2 Tax=Acinetobacter TaxID=469 RepID=A0A1H3M013_9GAMM|nr:MULTISPECIES: hypothetical protein [Acinetobacter]KAB0651385.1 hypothetical protein F7P73_13560 [Acinetobacter bohemicus]SDY70117.1 hypothetical protein SAMN05421643_12227 [Acinetobacter kyonggiensis]SFT12307.1 hypothetical protein SAMN05444586_102515 [Acinetobacter bohemicus]